MKTPKERAIFLFFVTTGLRRKEVFSLNKSDIRLSDRLVIPPKDENRTKLNWITLYNEECKRDLEEYLLTRRDSNQKLFPFESFKFFLMWKEAREKTGIKITPQVLREWFCNEMGQLGVPDRYIDAFCGRVPRSILARHYTDYSPERLKEIYDKAELKVLG